MSSSFLIQPRQFELRPLRVSPPGSPSECLYAVRFLFEGSDNWQTRFPTHVPPEVVTEFEAGNVVEVHLESLDDQGPAQRSLRGSPNYVILAAVLSDGTGLDCVPRELLKTRRGYLLRALAAVALGLVLVKSAPVLGGLVLGLATQPLRTALGVPTKARFSTRATLVSRVK